jgi:hypothetical protein
MLTMGDVFTLLNDAVIQTLPFILEALMVAVSLELVLATGLIRPRRRSPEVQAPPAPRRAPIPFVPVLYAENPHRSACEEADLDAA